MIAINYSYRLAGCVALLVCGSLVQAKAQAGNSPEILDASSAGFVTFSVSGGGDGIYQGTFPVMINSQNVVAGYYVDSGNVSHGFLRPPSGDITTFDVAGASSTAYEGTVVTAINANGVIVGYYYDANEAIHGFTRTKGGQISVVDAPGAQSAPLEGTQLTSINDSNLVVGLYNGADGTNTGFVRTPQNSFVSLQVPRSNGTVATGISSSGVITGYFTNFLFVFQAFSSSASKNIQKYTINQGQYGEYSVGINAQGVIVGDFYNDMEGDEEGFVGQTDGTTSIISYPGATSTHATSINNMGAVAGSYTASPTTTAGFLMKPDGTLASFQVPLGTSTWPTSLNAQSNVTGYYQVSGSSGVQGFLLSLH